MVAVTCVSLQRCFLRDCWQVPVINTKTLSLRLFWQNPESFYTSTNEPELWCIVLEREQSDRRGTLLPSFQEVEGRSWKATTEQLLHVNGHAQDFRVGIFKKRMF